MLLVVGVVLLVVGVDDVVSVVVTVEEVVGIIGFEVDNVVIG